ncbi:MAG TPA: hypothetical protein VGN14_02480 [Candidatus Elarobacter sp.]
MTLRDVVNASFLHRDRVRFRAGTSALLGVVLEPPAGAGIVVDVREVAELYRVDVAADGSATIGAFAAPSELVAALPAAFPPDAGAAAMRMRLALYGARLTIYGLGRTRVAAVEECTIETYELPATIASPAPPPGLGIGERRRATHDGDASYALGVTVALRVSVLGRFDQVRILLDLDGDVRRAAAAEAVLERQRCDRDLFPNAARAAAALVPANDARGSAAARALLPLVLAALRDAFDAAAR